MTKIIYEKELAKTFNVEEDQFVILKNVKNLGELERRRYIISQINLISMKIAKIEKLILSGNFSETRDMVMKKVSDLELRTNKLGMRTDFFDLAYKESEQQLVNIAEQSHNFASASETETAVKAITEIEEKFSIKQLPKAKSMLMELVEGIELLSLRAKNLELSLSTLRDLKLNEKIFIARKSIESQKTISDEEVLGRIEKRSVFNGKTSNWDSINESLKQIKSKR